MIISETLIFALNGKIKKSFLKTSEENSDEMISVVNVLNEEMSLKLTIDDLISIVNKKLGRIKIISIVPDYKKGKRYWILTIEKFKPYREGNGS